MEKQLTIKDGISIHQLIPREDEKYEISSNSISDITIPSLDKKYALSFNDEIDTWQIISDETIDLSKINTQIDSLKMIFKELAKTRIFSLKGLASISISPNEESDISGKFKANIILIHDPESKSWKLVNKNNAELYLNNIKDSSQEIELTFGDEITLSDLTKYKIYDEEIHVIGDTVVKLPILLESKYNRYEGFPDFHRSPRIIYRESQEKTEVAMPGNAPSKPQEQLLKTVLPPLVMLAVTILMAVIQPRGLYVIASAATTVMTIIFSITSYFRNRKKFKVESKKREEDYEKYLNVKSVELHQLEEKDRFGMNYHYPDIQTIQSMVEEYSPRIYEKTRLNFDFLFYRLGLGRIKNPTEIKSSVNPTTKDKLEKEGLELANKSQYLDDMPVVSDLMHGPVGYIGPRNLVIEQLQLLVNQLAFSHSYHDLQFVTIFPEDEKEKWDWMRWLPHAKIQDINVRGFVYDQRSRDQVLNSLNQILKERKNSMEENGSRESSIFTPHYVVLVTDEKLVLDHMIMEYLKEEPTELGCSVIFVQDVMSSLSENVKTVINVKDRQNGTLVIEQGELKNKNFKLDHFPENFDKEVITRTLAPLNHLQNLKSSIPESVTFLQMYDVKRFEDLNVTDRWEEHSPFKSLAVPLGLRGKDDIVELNLHEKAHGPHGLVAGTTGSGKSETIQSYILSLAVNFHPYDVAFLLIDYKGGGMANLFRNLPHLLGSITNLDGAQSMRALISINAELKRRQRLFSENNVNHINQYQKLYKNGEVEEPMPHLFLISDEFAELKAEQPEFMKELVSTARIGRSLGIHLILATQKPSGVVDDQIWSNSKFKLALKVADKADSMEMLKTPDAAEIVEPGRAYLQVGNNEVYELFQSAWSGADYQPDKEKQNIRDKTIYKINSLGQYEILNEDLSGLDEADEVTKIPTELEAIIDGIHETAETENIEPLPRPWLPPLPERVFLGDFDKTDYKKAWKKKDDRILKPVIGMVDIPSMQAQETLSVNLSDEGHLAVFSSPQYGKSTLLRTITLGLAQKHSPENLNTYLLDFGTNGLLSLKNLPQVVDYIAIDENEKILKFVDRIDAEMKSRKRLLSEYAVASIDMYEKASDKIVPRITFVIDGWDAIRDMRYTEQLEPLIARISREGASLGMHLIMSAGRSSGIKPIISGNIKLQVALKSITEEEARSIVGRTQLSIDDMPGRGLIKLDEPQLFQVALPVSGKDELEIIDNLQKQIRSMDEAWTNDRPEPIPMVPEILTVSDFERRMDADELENNRMPVGLNTDTVEVESMDLANTSPILTISLQSERVINYLQSQLKLLHDKYDDVTVIDTYSEDLIAFKENVEAYTSEESEVLSLVNKIVEEIDDREDDYEDMKESGEVNSTRDYVETVSSKFIVIADIGSILEEKSKDVIKALHQILVKGPKFGFFTITGFVGSNFREYDDVSAMLKKSTNGVVILNRFDDQNAIHANNVVRNAPDLDISEVYLVKNSIISRVKIPR